jgi:hypothetical protein
MIDILGSYHLESSSTAAVLTKYVFAKQFLITLDNNGDLSYVKDKLGNITNVNISPENLKALLEGLSSIECLNEDLEDE